MVTIYTTSDRAYTFILRNKRVPSTLAYLLTTRRIAKLGFGVRKALAALYHQGCLEQRAEAVYDVEKLICKDERFSRRRFLRFSNSDKSAYEYFPSADPRPGRSQSAAPARYREIRGEEKLILLCSYENMYRADRYRKSFIANFFESASTDYVEGLETVTDAMNHVALCARHGLYLTLLAYEPNVKMLKVSGGFCEQACAFFNTIPRTRNFRSRDYYKFCGSC